MAYPRVSEESYDWDVNKEKRQICGHFLKSIIHLAKL